mgnify:FL=1|tara:strand:- start:376 stop:1272 length:897 start_codon:yes stop_codon:yes gene_type:complete
MKSDKEILTELNKMKAQRDLWKDKQVKELVKLETLEEKIRYWETNLKYSSLLLPLSNGTDTINLSLEANINRDTRLLLLKAEIKRLDNTDDLISHRLREDFETFTEQTNDLKLTKKQFIKSIKKLVDNSSYRDLTTEMRSLGFHRYKGGRNLDTIVSQMNNLSIGVKNQRMFRHIYDGYKLAELKADIATFSKDGIVSNDNNRIEVNYAPKKFAALLKALSEKGVLNLASYDFNTNYYNGEATAKFITQHFKILSQSGPTKGSEASIETIKKAFQSESIATNKDKLIEAIKSLPKKAY